MQEKIEMIFEKIILFICQSKKDYRMIQYIGIEYDPKTKKINIQLTDHNCEIFIIPKKYQTLFHRWNPIEKYIKKQCYEICKLILEEDQSNDLPLNIMFTLNLETKEMNCNVKYKDFP